MTSIWETNPSCSRYIPLNTADSFDPGINVILQVIKYEWMVFFNCTHLSSRSARGRQGGPAVQCHPYLPLVPEALQKEENRNTVRVDDIMNTADDTNKANAAAFTRLCRNRLNFCFLLIWFVDLKTTRTLQKDVYSSKLLGHVDLCATFAYRILSFQTGKI